MSDDRSPDAIAEIRAFLDANDWRHGALSNRWKGYLRTLLTLLDAERSRSAEQEKEIARLKSVIVGKSSLGQFFEGQLRIADQQLAQQDAEIAALRVITTEFCAQDEEVGTLTLEELTAEIARCVNPIQPCAYCSRLQRQIVGRFSASPAVLPREDRP